MTSTSEFDVGVRNVGADVTGGDFPARLTLLGGERRDEVPRVDAGHDEREEPRGADGSARREDRGQRRGACGERRGRGGERDGELRGERRAGVWGERDNRGTGVLES